MYIWQNILELFRSLMKVLHSEIICWSVTPIPFTFWFGRWYSNLVGESEFPESFPFLLGVHLCPFTYAQNRLTVEHSHFDDETRLSQNCFVQFQKVSCWAGGGSDGLIELLWSLSCMWDDYLGMVTKQRRIMEGWIQFEVKIPCICNIQHPIEIWVAG